MNTFINVYCNHGTQRIYHQIRRYLLTHKKQQVPIILGTFFILSVMGAVILAILGQGYLRFGDFAFHYDRLIELHQDLVNHVWPSLNHSTGNPLGIATNVFYPWLTWLPFTLLTFLTRAPLSIFYLSFVIIVFIRFIISFCAYRTYDDNKFHGYIFAILYTLNASVFYWLFLSEDVGASLATDFLPLVLFGYLAYLRADRWRMLTAGLILVFYSHIVTALLSVVFIALLFVLNIQKLSWHKFLKMLIAGAVTLLLAMPQLYMMAKIILNNHIMTPGSNGVEFGQGLFTQLGVSIPIISITTAFSKHWRLSKLDKQLLAIGIFCFFINAHLVGDSFAVIFPWIRYIQFSVRFCVIEYLVFPFLLMRYLCNWSSNQRIREHQSFVKFMVMTILLIMPCIANFNSAKQVRSYQPVNKHVVNSLVNDIGSGKFHATFLTNKISGRELSHMPEQAYYMDYAPVASTWQWKSFLSCKPVATKLSATAKVYTTQNGLVVHSHEPLKNVQLPLVIYKGVDYRIKLNRHRILKSQINRHITQKYNLLTLKHLPSGISQVTLG